MNIVSRFQMILDKLLGVVQLQEWPTRLLQPHPPKTKRRVYPWQTLFNNWRTTPPRYWVKHFSLFLFLDLFLLFLFFLVDFCLWFWSLFFFLWKDSRLRHSILSESSWIRSFRSPNVSTRGYAYTSYPSWSLQSFQLKFLFQNTIDFYCCPEIYFRHCKWCTATLQNEKLCTVQK